MSETSEYYDSKLSDFLRRVEELLAAHEELRTENRQLREENQKLESKLESLKNKQEEIKRELEAKETSAVEFAGRMEKKFKEIQQLAESLPQ